MSAPTNFDKALIELNLSYAQIELVKQAVDKQVIGENEELNIYHRNFYFRNELRGEQRQSLWGKK